MSDGAFEAGRTPGPRRARPGNASGFLVTPDRLRRLLEGTGFEVVRRRA